MQEIPEHLMQSLDGIIGWCCHKNCNRNEYLSQKELIMRELPSGYYLESLNCLKNLETLGIYDECHSNQENYSFNLSELSNLKTLKFSLRKYSSSDESISLKGDFEGLKKLEVLDLSNNFLKEVPYLGNLTNLKILHLNNNHLTCLPDGINRLENLEELYIHNNNIHSHLSQIGSLKNLKILDISSGNYYKSHDIELPEDFGNMERLEIIKANDCKIKSLPESFSKLKNLKSINFSYNYIKKVPDLNQMNQLKEVDFFSCYVEKFPSIDDLVNIEKLNLSYNCLENDISFENNRKLKYINLSRASKGGIINKLPQGIENLELLEYLNLSGCNISSLPNLSNLKNLKTLDLSENDFSQIYIEPDILPNLTHLNLRKNKFIYFSPLLTKKMLEKKWDVNLNENPFPKVESTFIINSEYTFRSGVPMGNEFFKSSNISGLVYNKIYSEMAKNNKDYCREELIRKAAETKNDEVLRLLCAINDMNPIPSIRLLIEKTTDATLINKLNSLIEYYGETIPNKEGMYLLF